MKNLIFIFIFFFQGCLPVVGRQSNQVCFKNHCFQVELAQNDEERTRGLQWRESMDGGKGMLFIFPYPSKYGFWMKDTLIPLDMIWMDYARRVVSIVTDVKPCKESPCPTFTPPSDALYVFEINAGYAAKLGIKKGDVAVFKLR